LYTLLEKIEAESEGRTEENSQSINSTTEVPKAYSMHVWVYPISKTAMGIN
jgi:hypothetical protein